MSDPVFDIAADNGKSHVLAVTKLSPLLAPALNAAYNVHDRLHESDPKAFAAIAPKIRAIAASGDSKVPGSLLEQLPALEIVSVMGVGYDGVDVAAAKARNVVVTHTPNVLNDDVADLALALMLAVSRAIPASDRWVRDGTWEAKGAMPLQRKMAGARVGIVGMGRIGQAIAQRALGFRMEVSYTARSAKSELPYKFFPTPQALAAESDYLVIITPGGASTRKMIDASVFEALGKTGFVINVARGSVIDEAALIDALERGTIAGAGLDVFEDEPRVPPKLRALPNVVLTPHIGSATNETRQAMADLAFGNLDAKMKGKPLLTPVPECR